MKTLLASAAIGLMVLAAPAPASAQQVASLELTRVVIAPARSAVAEIVKSGLAQAYAGARPGTRAYEEAQRLYFFYGERYFEPLWLDMDAAGTVGFSAAAERIVTIFENAAREGLRPYDYLSPDLDPSVASGDPVMMAALETAFSGAVIRYANHIHSGRVRPSDVSGYFDIAPKGIDDSAILMRLAATDDPASVFAELEPRHPEFQALKAALANFEDREPPPRIADGPILRPGTSDPRVPQIRERLQMAALSPGNLYDEALLEAVRSFQGRSGLEVDGVIGPATIAALNGGPATSRNDIIANMERWRWMPEDLGAFNVFVNIPEFRLSINDNGAEAFGTRVIVGTLRNQTPIFSDRIRHVVVNPYWNLPNSVVREDIVPAVMRNPGYIANQNMELLYNGSVVGASSINWEVVSPTNFPFRVRQRPGPNNALGQIKFLFPNKHDVYLHDTPSKGLFSRSLRAFSRGCVRVEDPMAFADALMAYEANISRASLEAMFGPSERWVNPTRQIPVHIAYFTLRVGEDGEIRSFGDVYGHNERLIALLQE